MAVWKKKLVEKREKKNTRWKYVFYHATIAQVIRGDIDVNLKRKCVPHRYFPFVRFATQNRLAQTNARILITDCEYKKSKYFLWATVFFLHVAEGQTAFLVVNLGILFKLNFWKSDFWSTFHALRCWIWCNGNIRPDFLSNDKISNHFRFILKQLMSRISLLML